MDGFSLGTRWQSKHCIGCIHRDERGICNYFLHTYHRRPCPFGDGCTVKKTLGGEYRKYRKWNVKLAESMYTEGKTDVEIAKAVGVTSAAIGSWRKRTGRTRVSSGNYTAAYTKRRMSRLGVQSVIAEKRKQLGLTQYQLGTLCGVRRGMISAWESGRQPADWAALGRAGIQK